MTTMNKFAWLLAGWLAAGLAQAQTGPPAPENTLPGIEWESLTGEQQALLAGQEEDWEALPPGRQQAMAEGAERWLSMTPEQRATAQERWRKWRKLSPEQRERLQERWRSMTPEERQRAIQRRQPDRRPAPAPPPTDRRPR